MPVPGFGTYKIQAGDEAVSAVASALRSGYRNIDTASFYRNERSVGLAIRESGLDRSDIFISSKMWNDEQGYAGTLKAFDRTVAELGVQHLDLYLIHWPVQSTLESTWRALEHLYAAGRVSAIGVCNFDVHHLEQLMETASVVPMVNQIELHPRFQRTELTRYCKERGIAVQAWAPLMRGGVTAIEELVEIGRPHGKSAGQVALRWSIQEGYCPLPKSTDPVRIAENGAVLDFWLSPAEMEVVRGLDRDERVGPDPDRFSWNWPESTR